MNIQPDHVHLFLSASPCVAPADIAHQLKGATARSVFQRFPEIKSQLWGGALWSRSYYVGSSGDMSIDVVLKYIELGQDYMRKRFCASMTAFPLHQACRYIFDREMLDKLLCSGYMRGPILAESPQEREDRLSHLILLPEDAPCIGIVL